MESGRIAKELLRIARMFATEDVTGMKTVTIPGYGRMYTDGSNYLSVSDYKLEAAAEALAGMSGCSGCYDCVNCYDCVDCDRCTGCHGCTDCEDCVRCIGLKGESGRHGGKGC